MKAHRRVWPAARGWEGRSIPLGGVRAYLMMIDLDRKSVERILGAARKEKAA